MKIVVAFEIGQTVYLITDKEQSKRIVTGYNVRTTGITYGLSCGENETWHYDYEISGDKIFQL